ncbi:hypothetical protein Val02_23630 [Virgisporangium aliadipatigenens]|uniref:Uncharacterized protein n=1 Tax=Virgisporangium aliadipatigenens TaxID=741659 RepID=A0A8J4DQL2_9ACTN|nr:hypothetical protein [Virgisporangium aliadipatigenens]GIJ45477.1 hypothetical protein Val02_23630 [Virgisporangium aliadipatigenens]
MELHTTPGTIDDLVADAARAGYSIRSRMLRDWVECGLLDYPQRRPAGRGQGSQQALYSANQRNLLQNLLHHRRTNGIRSLARLPVFVWTYYGDEFVPTSQALRAINTWLGDSRSSLRKARHSAAEILARLDTPHASPAARRDLVDTLADIAYTGRADYPRLEQAIRNVFEPDFQTIRRAVGHPAAPMTTQSMIDTIRARVTAATRLKANDVSEDEFRTARHVHLVTYSQYARGHRELTAAAPKDASPLYDAATIENSLANCCTNLLTTLGLVAMHPERTSAVAAIPAPTFTFQVG